jgi:hypothetical protein
VDATTGLQHTFADLHHYVETEDTLDNMIRYDNFTSAAVEGFVQRNKHGGTYTFGNIHRYPFGERSQGGTGSRITGFTTYGYTDYTWLYGYVRRITPALVFTLPVQRVARRTWVQVSSTMPGTTMVILNLG